MIKKYTKEELIKIFQKLDESVKYSDVIKLQLENCIWINHPHTRLSFLKS